MLEGLGLTGLVRAEAMNVEELISLTTALKARLGDDADLRPADTDTGTDMDDEAD